MKTRQICLLKRKHKKLISFFILIISGLIISHSEPFPNAIKPVFRIPLKSQEKDNFFCPDQFFKFEQPLSTPTIFVCIPCPRNCQKCISEKTCSVCMDGFSIYKDYCTNYFPRKISTNFKQDLLYNCAIEKNCLCEKGFYFSPNLNSTEYSNIKIFSDNLIIEATNAMENSQNNSKNNLAYVSNGFIFNMIRPNCLDCKIKIPFCLVCSNQSKCLKCYPGFYLDLENSKCLQCPGNSLVCIKNNKTQKVNILGCKQSFYFSRKSNRCLKNFANCVLQDELECKECKKGFRLANSKKKCIVCGDHCLDCKDDRVCLNCESTFFYDPVLSKSKIRLLYYFYNPFIKDIVKK